MIDEARIIEIKEKTSFPITTRRLKRIGGS